MDIQLDYSIAQAYVPDVVRVILRQIVRFWIGDFGFWIGDFGFWIGDFGFWIGLLTSDSYFEFEPSAGEKRAKSSQLVNAHSTKTKMYEAS
jgi:hypothetical protein